MSSASANSRRQTATGVLHSGTVAHGLLLLEQIGEASNIPGLKGFAGVASLIVEICNVSATFLMRKLLTEMGHKSASSNKEEWKSLGHDVGELAMAVGGQVEEHRENIDVDLLDHISDLCMYVNPSPIRILPWMSLTLLVVWPETRQLEAVHDVLKRLSNRTSMTWLVKHSRDEVTLQRLRRDVTHALEFFNVSRRPGFTPAGVES